MRAPKSRPVTPQLVLQAYSAGLFPMAESADDPDLFWVDPEERGVFPLDGLIVSRSLAKAVRSDRFEVHVDRNFDAVIDACASETPGRAGTWINERIRALYGALFDLGHVHTIEAYSGQTLVGGLYGVSLGGAFFGESMFHRATDASKVCLLHLAARLLAGGFSLLDAQFVTPHLASLGAIAIDRLDYRKRLDIALQTGGNFLFWPSEPVAGRRVLECVEQARRTDTREPTWRGNPSDRVR